MAARRDLINGSIAGNLWALSWPMLISTTINMMGPTVDMIWVGRLGAASIAGVGVSALAITVINSIISGIFTGTQALIARMVGAGEEQNANRVAQQAFVIGTAFSILIALIGIFMAESILNLLGVAPNVVAQGAAYMRIQMVGIMTMSALSVAQSIMQASGDTVTPMKISVGCRILQMALCPALVFGFWIFPRLEISGASLSNVIAQGAGGIFALWILFSGRMRLSVTLKNFRFDGGIIWRTIRIGVPASITMMERSFAELILVRFVAPFGTIALAAHSLAQRIDWFVQMPSAGFGTAAGVLAAQNIGAGRPERANSTAWIATAMATGLSVLLSMVIWFRAEYLVGFFSTEPTLIHIASAFLRIQIAAYLVWGIVIAFSMILNGIGDTMIPMWTNLISMWGVQIGLAYVLPHYTSLGVYGVRWAVVIGIVIRSIIYPLYFSTGRWKHKKV